MEEDADLAVVAAPVAEGVLDLGLATRGRAGEVIVAHGNANAVLDLDLVVVVHAVRPALATVDREAGVLVVAVVDNLAANEVRHRLLAGRSELELGCLGGLEEDVGVAISVELAGGLSSSSNVVATLFVSLGDALDGIRPVLLHLENLRLGDRRQGRGRLGVGDGRVVEEDAQLAVRVLLVAEGVLDLGLAARGRAREVIVAHRNTDVALQLDLVVVIDAVGPALAPVDGEASILIVAIVDHFASHEVGHRLSAGRAELVLGSLGGLE
mmetsp:Transcript_44348/g.101667  ORF Transcript_44348/g.101667 Transcript_44348/m.101667 type:complete len:268 (-) Transcript_44348:322-1125(-)